MAKQAGKERSGGSIGCGYMLIIGFVICALLIINGMLVKAFMNINAPDLDTRLKQAAQFVFPVVMIFVEFWLFDLLNRKK